MALKLLWAVLGTIGFCIIFHVPKRSIFPATVNSLFAWILYWTALDNELSPVLATFFSACAVALLADIFARTLKEAATVYIIPGIMPLVPGAGIYYTLYAFINGSSQTAMEKGSETLMIAGAIAVALISVSFVVRTVVNVKRSIKNLPNKLRER